MKNSIIDIIKLGQRLRRVNIGEGIARTRVDVVTTSFSPEFTQKESKGVFTYPECFEVKIENKQNHFYSVRTRDNRWIPEGMSLNGKGLSIGQVYKLMLKEAFEANNRGEK